MACDTMSRPGQSLEERRAAVKAALAKLRQAIAAGKVRPVVGPQGSIAFRGWSGEERDGVTDACAFRRLQAEGSPELRRALATEAAAGRTVSRVVVGSGVHSHDGGATWHPGHKHGR